MSNTNDSAVKRYELTSETHPSIPKLRRIRALVDMPRHGVSAGDLGGWIESGENLSGGAWVSGEAPSTP